MKLELHVTTSGLMAERSAEFLESVTGEKPTASDPPAHPADQRALDPVAVAGIILSIPGAVLALTQLVDHFRDADKRRVLKNRVEALLDSASGAEQQAVLLVGDKTVDLTRATSDEVLDALETAATKADRERRTSRR